jgi:ribosomal protein S19
MGRSNWKGPYINPKDLKSVNLLKKNHATLAMSRGSEIIPKFLGLTFKVSNGKDYTEIDITEEMVGHKFGEFSPTRGKFAFKRKKSKK